MPRLLEFIPFEWKERFEKDIQPPIYTIEEFFERDSIEIVRCLKCCTFEFIENMKKEISWKLLNHSNCNEFSQNSSQGISCLSSAIPQSMNYHTQGAMSFRPTGFPELDDVFPTGYPSGQIISILGEGQTGKTQLVMTSVVASAMRGYNTLLIDTCNHTSLKRLSYIVQYSIKADQLQNPHMVFTSTERGNERINEILSKISIHRCYSIFDLLDLLTKIKSLNGAGYDLIAIDSVHHLIAPLQSEVIPVTISSASNSIATLQPFLSQLNILMKSLSLSHQITILVTNVLHNKDSLIGTSSALMLRGSSSNAVGIPELQTGGFLPALGVYDFVLKLSINIPETDQSKTVINAGKCDFRLIVTLFIHSFVARGRGDHPSAILEESSGESEIINSPMMITTRHMTSVEFRRV
jgi:RecA/RadA recombinase